MARGLSRVRSTGLDLVDVPGRQVGPPGQPGTGWPAQGQGQKQMGQAPTGAAPAGAGAPAAGAAYPVGGAAGQTPGTGTPPPAAGRPGQTAHTQAPRKPIDWKNLPVADYIYPGVAVLLLGMVLFTPWYQSFNWAYGVDGEAPGALVILSVLLAIVAALLGLPERMLPEQVKTLPVPLKTLRLALLAPLALAVLIAIVRVLGEDEGMGSGVQLATVGIILVALMGLPAAALEKVRIAAIVCLGIALVSLLWPMRHLFPLNSFTTPFLLIGLVTAAVLGWLILGLVRQKFPDWAAVGFFGIVWVLITISDAGTLTAGVGAL